MSKIEAVASAAALFAALGDPTRLGMVAQLADGDVHSIVALSAGSDLTRQAITKHLQVLARAGLVESRRAGRESLYALRPERIDEAQTYLACVAAQWDSALKRLKAHLEEFP